MQGARRRGQRLASLQTDARSVSPPRCTALGGWYRRAGWLGESNRGRQRQHRLCGRGRNRVSKRFEAGSSAARYVPAKGSCRRQWQSRKPGEGSIVPGASGCAGTACRHCSRRASVPCRAATTIFVDGPFPGGGAARLRGAGGHGGRAGRYVRHDPGSVRRRARHVTQKGRPGRRELPRLCSSLSRRVDYVGFYSADGADARREGRRCAMAASASLCRVPHSHSGASDCARLSPKRVSEYSTLGGISP